MLLPISQSHIQLSVAQTGWCSWCAAMPGQGSNLLAAVAAMGVQHVFVCEGAVDVHARPIYAALSTLMFVLVFELRC